MTLAQIVSGARALLLDFDGPVCSVFAGYPAPRIADELKGVLAAREVLVPAEIDSPHELYVGQLSGTPDLRDGWTTS